ncbi:integrase core domain-containing protein [Nocardia fluminea]|uniref:integrase core domain-containing protein n=1 Tax=Nocardia fluminea TaxID=134984 RepID=UPI00371DA376
MPTIAPVADVECTLMEWVDWYNNVRLHSRLGYLTPAGTRLPTSLKPLTPNGTGQLLKRVLNP